MKTLRFLMIPVLLVICSFGLAGCFGDNSPRLPTEAELLGVGVTTPIPELSVPVSSTNFETTGYVFRVFWANPTWDDFVKLVGWLEGEGFIYHFGEGTGTEREYARFFANKGAVEGAITYDLQTSNKILDLSFITANLS